MEKVIITLVELVEHCSEANKLLVSNAIDMENGEVLTAQKHLKEASNLLSVMLKDVFIEVKGALGCNIEESEDYDYSVLDLSKLLSNVIYNAACLINNLINNDDVAVKNVFINKLIKNLNAVVELTQAILLN